LPVEEMEILKSHAVNVGGIIKLTLKKNWISVKKIEYEVTIIFG